MLDLRLARQLLYVGVTLYAGTVLAQAIPDNAQPVPFGSGWTCVRGYSKSGNRCVKIVLPENATLDYTGNSWTCIRGHRKSGDGCAKVVVPENATLDYTGANWICAKGYRKSGDGCAKVVVPANATLDYTGSNWICTKGYRKAGDGCSKVVIPENATLDYTGSNWTCSKGFRKSGDGCSKVAVPENGTLDYTGSNWICQRGYRKVGDGCVALAIPENASIDHTGNNWACAAGYKRVGDKCSPLTAEEARQQRALEEKVRQRVLARQQRLAKGEDCQTEFKTNAEVCVVVTRIHLDCNQSSFGSYYDDCDAVLNYDVRTDYSGGSTLHAGVECKVVIDYSGKSAFSSSTDSQRKSDTHDLHAHANLSERLRYNFSFGSFDQITRARITSAQCEIDSVDLW